MNQHRVFLIEDDSGIRTAFTLCLEEEGYKVESFSNGRDALDRLAVAASPCVILLDLMMPVMNGVEFMRRLALQKAPVIPVPVYLVSAAAAQSQSVELGCFGFLKKPVELEILLEIVGQHCPKDSSKCP